MNVKTPLALLAGRLPWIYLILSIILPAEAGAGLAKLAEKMPAKVLYLDVEGEMRPVVGVKSLDNVMVLMPDKSRKTFKYKNLAYADKELPPIGRITLCDMEGSSLTERYYLGDVVMNTDQSNLHMEVVADRPLEGVYAVVSYSGLTPDGSDVITMGVLGDLPAGELVKRDVFLRSVAIPGGTKYNVTFYCNGFPIEQFRLKNVATSAQSRSLLIPWECRIGHYLTHAKEKKRDAQPQPFFIPLSDTLKASCKEQGITEVRVLMNLNEDGGVDLVEPDEQLAPEQVAMLEADLRKWQFFPATSKGKPFRKQVKVPLRF